MPNGTTARATTTGSTGMQRGGRPGASAGDAISATGIDGPAPATTAAARRSTARSPTTKQPRSASGASRNSMAIVSGPMPAGSPAVIASGRSDVGAELIG